MTRPVPPSTIWRVQLLDGEKILITGAFLDEDPVATAERLRPILENRWCTTGVEPLLAAPFHVVVPYEWNRYVP